MLCSYCRKFLLDNAQFCYSCGNEARSLKILKKNRKYSADIRKVQNGRA